MNSRARVFALCGLAALLALGAGLMLLGGGPSSSGAATALKPLHRISPRKRLENQRRARRLRGAQRARALHRAAVQPISRPHLKRTAKPRRRTVGPVAPADGVPSVLAQALAQNAVVVVSLVSPQASVDQMAEAEAKAGAALAGVGFLAVSTANEAVISTLTTLVNSSQAPTNRLLDSPAVLVFQRPNTLFVRLNGFVDRQTVEQAAANAFGGQ